MLNLFKTKKPEIVSGNEALAEVDFNYLVENQYYFDSACQTMRPEQVIKSESQYYHEYNACGGRVKYKWGQTVDEKVEDTRLKLLKLVGKSAKDYAVVFTLNTTYGINLVLQQLPAKDYKQIVTSEIEHNSVFLPSMTWAQKNGKSREVLKRNDDGSVDFQGVNLAQSIVVVNTVSNIDGRKLVNLAELEKEVHRQNGILLLDAAQNFSHDLSNLEKVDFDAVFGSGHKMYGPSIGFIIIKKNLIKSLEHFWLGGGTVNDVEKDSYKLIEQDFELHSTLELGLQNWSGIIGLGEAIDWLKSYKPNGQNRKVYEEALAQQLFDGLKALPQVHLLNSIPSSIVSFYVDNLDAHRLALYLSEQNIMCRSGYFCCHYYLKNLKKYPPLLRVSLGLNNTPEQVKFFIETLSQILKAI